MIGQLPLVEEARNAEDHTGPKLPFLVACTPNKHPYHWNPPEKPGAMLHLVTHPNGVGMTPKCTEDKAERCGQWNQKAR